MVARAGALGLHTRINPPADAWREGASEQEMVAGAQLVERMRARAAAANMSDSRLVTALGWLEDFVAAYPHRILVQPLGGEHHYSNAVHNEESFGMLQEFILERGSKQKGRAGQAITAKTAAGYVSAIRAEAGLGAGYRLFDAQFAVEVPRAAKFARRLDGPAGTRKLRRGLRAQHFAAAAAGGFDRSTRPGVRRWARMLSAHNLLMRGGEPGTTDDDVWDPDRGHISWDSVKWLTPAETASEYAAVRLLVMPIKDPDAKYKPVPLLIRRRQLPFVPRGADAVCTYDALATMWDMDVALVSDRARTPLFSVEGPGSRAVTTSDMRDDARAVGAAVGIPVSELGGPSFRIGGAEDFYDVLGPASQEIIDQRGRWHSDIAEIYKRCSATSHLSASAAVGDAAGISLEALGDGWACPARR